MGIVNDLCLLCQDLDGHCIYSAYNVKIWMGIVSDICL